ncbi:family 43 glycosylhydrolase [Mucilaginibacter sp. ZT4R22]|uniref:Family 43 glycosylhydrolase n=1 Tax=Mucilaginibacter pankratovii TaxID=2772110 RepID=A0ABR7WY74_9SPHI|nr:family 43 glycosylhydrolase [Mucilaginibacter pankratovii]MBD1367230.1 family 43 glycosylhydrolase [Mucilaginibacter pankratovii]
MSIAIYRLWLTASIITLTVPYLYAQKATNPIIYADVPDISIVRVGNSYYMSSTTMHMSPGVPIMKSDDLVTWKTVGYAYDTLANIDPANLANGKNMYGEGSWASSIRLTNAKNKKNGRYILLLLCE